MKLHNYRLKRVDCVGYYLNTMQVKGCDKITNWLSVTFVKNKVAKFAIGNVSMKNESVFDVSGNFPPLNMGFFAVPKTKR